MTIILPIMKRSIVLLIAVGICSSFNAFAAPAVASNDNSEFLWGGADLSKLSVGLYSKRRSVEVTGITAQGGSRTPFDMDMRKITGYLGYDVSRWATAYLIGGSVDTRFDADFDFRGFGQDFNGAKAEYGAGVTLNLVDHDFADPTFSEDRIRLHCSLEYTRGSSKWEFSNTTTEWDELFGSLIVSFINDIDGNKEFWPHSIGIYAGPIYSHISSSSLEAGGTTGFTAGLTAKYSERITFDIGIERLEKADVILGASIKF